MMKRMIVPLLAGWLVAGAHGAGTLDQVSPNTNSGLGASFDFQQDVVVGLAGQLTQVDVYVRSVGNAKISLWDGAPWQPGAAAFEFDLVGDATGWASIDTTAANLFFDVGDHFSIGVSPPVEGSGATLGANAVAPEGEYLPGRLYMNGDVFFGGQMDLAFQTYMTVPEPGSVSLLGLTGLALLRRRGWA